MSYQTSSRDKNKRGRLASTLRYIKWHKYLYFMLIPVFLYYAVFMYAPMYGATIAFRDYKPLRGILGSPWVGFENFRTLLGQAKFWEVFNNTIRISFIRLVWGFPFPIIVSLMLNEVRQIRFKRIIQTTLYIPHFISWVVVGGLMVNMLSIDGGVVNNIIVRLGGQPIAFLTSESVFVPTLVVSMIWKTFGWNTIIYLAAMAGIDPQLYEAATVDGANRWQQMLKITLPSIRTIIVIILITRIGSIMQAGFEQIFVLYHPGVYRTADIIDTYVYRLGLQDGKFELASAVGLFKSVINFALIVIANKLSRMAGEEGIY